jgi:predicted enzyme related to lactoylglutathione lyase
VGATIPSIVYESLRFGALIPQRRRMNLNQVTLPALDVTESAKFYRKMGFVQIVDSPHYARFECTQGDATFSLHRVESLPTDTCTTVYFENSDLDALVERLQAAGFDFRELPADQPYLWREARLHDPAGNLLCLYWAGENRKYPPWRVERT